MKQSSLLIPDSHVQLGTKGEDPSQSLLVNAGFLGAFQEQEYVFLPLAMRVIDNIQSIVNEELEKLSAVEFQLPVHSSIRGEEYLTNFLLKEQMASSIELPIHLYQIQTVLDVKKAKKTAFLPPLESTFLDVFSFHESQTSLQENYYRFEKMFERILNRCELAFQNVIAVSESVGEEQTKEFIALSPLGDTVFVTSTVGEYRAKLDVATRFVTAKKSHATYLPLTHEKLSEAIDQESGDWLTYRLLRMGKQPIMFFYQAKDQMNLTKLRHFLGGKVVEVKKSETEKYFGQSLDAFDFQTLPENVWFLGDREVENLTNVKLYSPVKGMYYQNVNPLREFPTAQYADFLYVQEGDMAPDETGTLVFQKGIKIGQMYQKKLSEVSDSLEGKHLSIGHYQLDLSRLFLMIAHQHRHESGILWPMEVSPFDVHLIPEDLSDAYQSQLVEEVEAVLVNQEYQVLLDDRELSMVEKVREASLIGCPIVILIGKKAVEGIVELKISASDASIEVRKEELMDTLAILLQTTE